MGQISKQALGKQPSAFVNFPAAGQGISCSSCSTLWVKNEREQWGGGGDTGKRA